MKKVAILGSTGSIGRNTLDVIENFPSQFQVVSLAAGSNVKLLAEQAKRFRPRYVAIQDESKGELLQESVNGLKGVRVFSGEAGIARLASERDADIVVVAISGSSALAPLLEAIRQGKTIALANKEALVMAGAIVMREASRHKARLIPVDSEHSAIFQCTNGSRQNSIKKIILTGTGGPLFRTARHKLSGVSPELALAHPKWRMGRKITIDSATLMNKGLEVIEAHWLFGVDEKKIEVLLHPEALIHSMVEFTDGSFLAQLAPPDMRLPIQYALTYPERRRSLISSVDFARVRSLTFFEPDIKKFPCLALARQALVRGGTMPAVLNGANEVAVAAFLDKKILFTDIPNIIRKVMAAHKVIHKPTLEQIFLADRRSRREAGLLCSR